jgi:hypothetical protein
MISAHKLAGIICTSLLLSLSAGIQAGGMDGYLSYGSSRPPAGYGYGVGFYSAVWPLMDQQLSNFQVGLPGCWVTPNNSDNTTKPQCPIGTYARDHWPERGPTYGSVFQTMEGGLGYWARNHFRYGPPKFSMNGTPNCYTNEIATPGWSFFYSNTALPDTLLGIAQLSNRLLVPPDALPFQGNPAGQLCGYTWMILPLTDAKAGPPPIGNQSWTLFLSTSNFKGPVAYYLPETWAKISFNFPFDYGRGLDARPGDINGGAMEWNTIPLFEATASGTTYGKTPLFKWPCDSTGKGILLTDYTYYSRSALYNSILTWRQGGAASPGTFDTSTTGRYVSTLSAGSFSLKQNNNPITFNNAFKMTTFGTRAWGMQWAKPTPPLAVFSEYWKQSGTNRVPITAAEVPVSTGLKTKSFTKAGQGVAYTSPATGSWATPGPKSGPFKAYLADKSIATYYWYRFIDQPVFQQYKWTTAEKANLQSIIEKIHANWTINKVYIPLPSVGTLAALDPALIVKPPAGLEVGYVPIVTKQEYNPNPVPVLEIPAKKNSGKNLILQTGNSFCFSARETESYTIELCDFKGVRVAIFSVTGQKEFRLPGNIAAGFYLLSARSPKERVFQKVFVAGY